jgi:hypothetical protein
LSLLSLLLLALIVLLVLLLTRSYQRATNLVMNLLRNQLVENQKLRNQILASDVPTLAALNSTTLPSSDLPEASGEIVDLSELSEALSYEEDLVSRGYQVGDVGNDLGAAGWPDAVIRAGAEGPTAYDVS